MTNVSPTVSDLAAEPLRSEAVRLFRRYSVEVVEALGFCPWAERARQTGTVREIVLTDEVGDIDATLRAIDSVSHDEGVEVAVLIYPKIRLSRRDFEWFHSRARDADGSRYPYKAAPMASAAFHPDAQPNVADPDLLKPFVRRTPDPTVQLLRRSVLDRIKGHRRGGTIVVDIDHLDLDALIAAWREPVADAVARTNVETVERVGVERVTALFDEIRRDRNDTYRRLGLEVA